MQLRFLHTFQLEKEVKHKQANGVNVSVFQPIGKYDGVVEDLQDTVSATVYGADVKTMKRIRTIRGEMETFLNERSNNSNDNVSNYRIKYEGKRYKIIAVRKNGIEISGV